jgi:hypothetical protein
MKRIHRSTEAWQKLFHQQEQSRMSASAFCEQQGLSTQTFYHRCKALRSVPAEKPRGFIPVKTDSTPAQTSASSRSILLHYREIRLHLPDSKAPGWIASLVETAKANGLIPYLSPDKNTSRLRK